MVGAVTNVGIFFVAARLAKTQIALEPKGNSRSADAKGIHWIMPVMLVSGGCVIHFRGFLDSTLKPYFWRTVYAFSIMLACFLAGIALGGLAAGRLATDQRRSRFLFSVAQVFIALTALGSYWVLQWWVPEGRSLVSSAAYAALVMLPTTVFIGATYPLRCESRRERHRIRQTPQDACMPGIRWAPLRGRCSQVLLSCRSLGLAKH